MVYILCTVSHRARKTPTRSRQRGKHLLIATSRENFRKASPRPIRIRAAYAFDARNSNFSALVRRELSILVPESRHPKVDVGVINGRRRRSLVFPGDDHNPSVRRIYRAIDKKGGRTGCHGHRENRSQGLRHYRCDGSRQTHAST